MTTSNEELRPIVEAMLVPDMSVSNMYISMMEFSEAANPAKVKAMLDQIDALTKDRQTLADALEKIIAKCEGRKP